MTSEQLIEQFKGLTDELVKTIEAKNHDYSKGNDPFKNLRRHGCYGIVVRMDDKISRLDTMTNPAHGDPVMRVKDESFEDTNKDLAAYALLNILLRRETLAIPKVFEHVQIRKSGSALGFCDNPFHNNPGLLGVFPHEKDSSCKDWGVR